MSVIILFLARKMVSFCMLKKTFPSLKLSKDFLKLVWCTRSQAGIFQDILPPQPEIFSKLFGISSLSPEILYPCRSRNTFQSWRKIEFRMGNAQNFPLSAMGVFQDQEWKIPGESWNSFSIFNSVEYSENMILEKYIQCTFCTVDCISASSLLYNLYRVFWI